VADLDRNHRPFSVGTGGRFEPEQPADFAGITRYAWEVVINDIDPLVYAFWWSVLNDTESLSRKIHDTPVTMQVWHQQKIVHAHADQYSTTDVGFATFFLNRTNRSGILQGGVIGGKNQDGPFKLDARFNKKDMLERIDLHRAS
jgi:DNA adenine methylase